MSDYDTSGSDLITAEPTGDPFDQANRLARAIVVEWENGGGDGALQSNIVSVLAPLLAKLRAVEGVMARCNACRTQAASVNRPAVAMAYDDAGEWLRRALDAS